MRAKLIDIGLSVFLIALCAEAFGQGAGRGKGMSNSTYQRLYDTATVKTVEGEVSKVEYFSPKQGMGQGVHLQLKKDDELLAVHLGPRWFLDKQDVQIAKGDHIKVTGSLITINEQPVIIAAEIAKDDEILRLRDDKGFPAWAGWRNRNR
jgi:hypothetical protein